MYTFSGDSNNYSACRLPHWCKRPQTTNLMTSQELSASVYRQLFTDAQWDAIDSALSDYADYGDDEAEIATEIKHKIFTIFNLTA